MIDMNSNATNRVTKVLELISPHLSALKRQRTQSLILKACSYGSLTSALAVALYATIWPDLATNMFVLGAALLGQYNSEFLFKFVPAIMLWLSLSTLVIGFFAAYFAYQQKDLPNSNDVLHHLNRLYPALEESAHLGLGEPHELSVLQSMQLQRIWPLLLSILEKSDDVWQGSVRRQSRLSDLLWAVVIGVSVISTAVLLRQSTSIDNKPSAPESLEAIVSNNYLNSLLVSITAPTYTQQMPFTQSALDIQALQGSVIEWLVPFNISDRPVSQTTFELLLSHGETLPFEAVEQGYQLTYIANRPAVYSITQTTGNNRFTSDIATLAVTVDAKPRINIKKPLPTITELAKNSSPTLLAEVAIADDYALSKVTIVASIAKGSGESVKFRDQNFDFDSYSIVDGQNIYLKSWDFKALNMEPGDELYFSVHATDNKTPEAQTSISPTKIIRWLEDEEKGISGEGIVIDFMPEYFKSQRQIIIETEALITQQDIISAEVFKQTSRALAIDQSELKQSYGQYLGDEFESGVMHTMEAGLEIPSQDEHEHSHDEKDHDESEHSHSSDSQVGETADRSGYQQVIEQFGHNHGEADIGFIKTSAGQINPKVLMKRALAEMWQAELHLQMSDPALALPYEKEALSYLNRAKQAERIYVKRLGFEPPPVSEERRYQGKLKDILSYQRSTQVTATMDLDTQIRQLLSMLNDYMTSSPHGNSQDLSDNQRGVVDVVVQLLSEGLTQAPERLEQLAILKRVQMANSFSINDCNTCLPALMRDLHDLLSAPLAPPVLRRNGLSIQHKASKAYSEALLQHSNQVAKSSLQ